MQNTFSRQQVRLLTCRDPDFTHAADGLLMLPPGRYGVLKDIFVQDAEIPFNFDLTLNFS
ncbi:hypothetical protein A5320_07235 [Rheinheimera sp. SA_1]|nr:hypothetical protein A5320_07235 [Rheinheimera sp. SA_1]